VNSLIVEVPYPYDFVIKGTENPGNESDGGFKLSILFDGELAKCCLIKSSLHSIESKSISVSESSNLYILNRKVIVSADIC
jgi:hypothetical protein